MGKILRTQHGELCLIPSTQEKVVGGSVIKLWGGDGRERQVLGPHWPARLAKMFNEQ